MGHRITTKAWLHLKENFAEDIKKMTIFEISVDRCNLFNSRAKVSRKEANKGKVRERSNIERYGIELGPIFDWLNENANDQYYAERGVNSGTSRNAMIVFYFMDEGDAMAFKLMFSEKT